MFITRRAIPRRVFLSAAGASVALPLLESMVPAMTAIAQTPARPAMRFGAESRNREFAPGTFRVGELDIGAAGPQAGEPVQDP